jgi:hypothetical protein
MQSKSLTYRILALSMAFLVLFSSVGFSMDLHYCQGELKSFSLIGKAKSCHEMAKKVFCPHHQKMMTMSDEGCEKDQKDCCNNEKLFFQLDQDQQIQNLDLVLSQQLKQFIVAYLSVILEMSIIKNEAIPYAQYKPPLIQKDIHVLIQSFLL